MDRIRERSDGFSQRILRGLVVAVLVVAVVALQRGFWPAVDGDVSAGSGPRIPREHLRFATVQRGMFEDFIAIRGVVKPARTTFVDAVDGGRVETVEVAAGAMVHAGQLLLRLANPGLELDIVSRKSLIATQINQLRDAELSIERERLDRDFEIAEMQYDLKRLRRQEQRLVALLTRNAVSPAELEDLRDELDYKRGRLHLAEATRVRRRQIHTAQLVQLAATGKALAHNVELAEATLGQLEIRAPSTGQLTHLVAEVGQTMRSGSRVAQIDVAGDFEVRASIDEFHLQRVHLDEQARLNWHGTDFLLKVRQILPQIVDGRFEIVLRFVGESPGELKKGQTLELQLGGPRPEADSNASLDSVLVPYAPFFHESGGRWIFVVGDDGQSATRREIEPGRRNSRAVEIINGLEQGERVIISSYKGFETERALSFDAESN